MATIASETSLSLIATLSVLTGAAGHIVEHQCEDFPEEYLHGHTCDLCGINRRRIEVYILKDGAGNYSRVGRNCLAKLWGEERLTKAEKALIPSGIENFAHEVDVTVFVTSAYLSIKSRGWISSGEAYRKRITSTTKDALLPGNYGTPPSDEERAEVAAMIAWGKTLVGELGSFEDKLSKLCACEGVHESNVGLLAYLPVYYTNVRERATETNEWAGTVGKKLTVELKVVKQVFWGGYYGTTVLHIMKDASGRTFTWKASGGKELPKDRTIRIAGTVKEHSDYKGTKQTVLTRCKEV